MQHRTAQGHMDHGVQIGWEPVQSWIEKALRKGWLAEIGVTVATLSILGWSMFAFQKAMENYQIMGLGVF